MVVDSSDPAGLGRRHSCPDLGAYPLPLVLGFRRPYRTPASVIRGARLAGAFGFRRYRRSVFLRRNVGERFGVPAHGGLACASVVIVPSSGIGRAPYITKNPRLSWRTAEGFGSLSVVLRMLRSFGHALRRVRGLPGLRDPARGDTTLSVGRRSRALTTGTSRRAAYGSNSRQPEGRTNQGSTDRLRRRVAARKTCGAGTPAHLGPRRYRRDPLHTSVAAVYTRDPLHTSVPGGRVPLHTWFPAGTPWRQGIQR